jgi:retron-type reverse transcriptase
LKPVSWVDAERIIMNAIASEIADGNILRLIEKFLRSSVMENFVFKPTTIGTPQGGLCKESYYAK